MEPYTRNRTIGHEGRAETSTGYKIELKNRQPGQDLVVNVDHTTLPFRGEYRFAAAKLEGRKSIHLVVKDPTSPVAEWSPLNIQPDAVREIGGRNG